ncbi:DEAD/DEAH box helicase [Gleimia sp. 6138-11-ORH1]|uniref:DEAD/DEAH box helicase n=1 Tax=Gleimia sp. 6138-11-ORH1 TaxID=2973937 RepID=UPI002169C7C2|nr:DEAD/DEAH box helicase [Gleimia sp. 6138-11-ORH1]MCS4483977.1 DEAD/DEAH box helicase [Gleimia sp. 6138-11-ORH1]
MADSAKHYSAAVVNLAGVEYSTSQNDATPDIEEKLSTTDLKAKTFADFGVSDAICEALTKQGITHPFPIQALTLPVALAGRDIIGQAKTGTGKTLGFGLPVLMKVAGPDTAAYATEIPYPGHPQALIIVPTRELCKQVAADLRVAAKQLSTRIVEIYGGAAFEPQISALEKGAEVVVGTPGRLIDLLKRKILQLHGVNAVVLDEADEMLDLGFLPDVEVLLSRVPQTRQTMLFSATMPGEVVALARRYMKQPTHIRAQEADDSSATVKTVKQVIYRCHALNKIEVVARILQARERGLAVIFTRTKRTTSNLAEDLTARGFAVASLHGDLGQGAREQAMRAFRSGKVDVLVATDIAARGIDVDDVTHVINYQCPEDEKIYLHRIGRTGRAGASGTAVTFVDWDDVPRWGLISKALNLGVPQPLETYHTSAHLYSDLDIPQEVTGRLPRARRTRAGLDAEVYEDVSGKGRRSAGRSGSNRAAGRSGSGRSGSGRSGSGRSGSGRSSSARSGSARSGRSAETNANTKRPRRRVRRTRDEQ